MHIDLSLPYELLALETALAACTRGLEAEASEVEVWRLRRMCFAQDLVCCAKTALRTCVAASVARHSDHD